MVFLSIRKNIFITLQPLREERIYFSPLGHCTIRISQVANTFEFKVKEGAASERVGDILQRENSFQCCFLNCRGKYSDAKRLNFIFDSDKQNGFFNKLTFFTGFLILLIIYIFTKEFIKIFLNDLLYFVLLNAIQCHLE